MSLVIVLVLSFALPCGAQWDQEESSGSGSSGSATIRVERGNTSVLDTVEDIDFSTEFNVIQDGTDNETDVSIGGAITRDTELAAGLEAQDECNEITNCVPNAYDAIEDIPQAPPTNGDITHLSTADQIYDFCETTQDYLKTSENNDTLDDLSNDNLDSLQNVAPLVEQQYDIIYFDGTYWNRLAHGVDGQCIQYSDANGLEWGACGTLTDGSVTNAKLAADAVTTDKIAAGAVETGDIKNNTISDIDIYTLAAIKVSKLAHGTLTDTKYCTYDSGSDALVCNSDGGGTGSPAFNDITTGTNTTASMTIGSGAELLHSGTGKIDASHLAGKEIDHANLDNNTVLVYNSGTGKYESRAMQNQSDVNIDGGTIDNATIGSETPAKGSFSELAIGSDPLNPQITNTEFIALDGVTENIQSQFNNMQLDVDSKLDSTANNDTLDDLSNDNMTALSDVADNATTWNNVFIYYDNATRQWTPFLPGSDGECLKFSASAGLTWGACGTTTGGGGSIIVKENDTIVLSTVDTLDFLGADFDVAQDGSDNETNVVIASAITRDSEWDTQGEVETVWGVTLATDAELSSGLAGQDTCAEITGCVEGAVTTSDDSVDSSELDNLCSTDDKVLKRVGGAWGCADPATGGGTPGGSSGDIQYNNAGAFGGYSIVPIGNLPTAAVTTGDTTHSPTSDDVFNFCETTQDYLKTSENNDSADDVSLADVQTATTNDFHNIGGTDANTNAGTICANGEYLNGDGTCDAGYLDADGVDFVVDLGGVVNTSSSFMSVQKVLRYLV
ncbi:MAG: hypothetical protein L3J79_09095 [Candidatus Marinimicrobia bacterium]|nr:hypothetical protein [Candidatus Neomarinimicrobiota bacterium]